MALLRRPQPGRLPGERASLSRGKLVILAILVLAALMSASAVWLRHSREARAQEAWGRTSAQLISTAPMVELLKLAPLPPVPPVTPSSDANPASTSAPAPTPAAPPSEKTAEKAAPANGPPAAPHSSAAETKSTATPSVPITPATPSIGPTVSPPLAPVPPGTIQNIWIGRQGFRVVGVANLSASAALPQFRAALLRDTSFDWDQPLDCEPQWNYLIRFRAIGQTASVLVSLSCPAMRLTSDSSGAPVNVQTLNVTPLIKPLGQFLGDHAP